MWRLDRITAFLLFSLFLMLPAPAQARPGELDRSFGQNGKLVKAVDLEPDAWSSASATIARPSAEVTVVLAGKTLLALGADGRRAPSFGGGRVEIAPPGPGLFKPTGITAVPGGGVIVGGTYGSPTASSPGDSFGEKVVLIRYRPDGTVDLAFGSNGYVIADFGFPPPADLYPPSALWIAPRVQFKGVAVDPQGRVILTGRRMTMRASCRAHGPFPYFEHFAARLLGNGQLDPTFAEGGVVRLPQSGEVGQPLTLRGGGFYLAGPDTQVCSPSSRFLLSRLGPNGWLIPTFGGGGVLSLSPEAVTDQAALARDRQGRLLLAATYAVSPGPAGIIIYRVLPTGELDMGFGFEGRVILATGEGFAPSAIAVDGRERILLAGESNFGTAEAPEYSFAVERLTAKGQIDRSFGSDGMAVTRFGRLSQARATSMKLMPRGRILVTGTVARPSLPGGEGVAVARYLNR